MKRSDSSVRATARAPQWLAIRARWDCLSSGTGQAVKRRRSVQAPVEGRERLVGRGGRRAGGQVEAGQQGGTVRVGVAEVVVGVHEAGVPRQVLEAAFSWADRTGAPLRVVHAWRLDAAYDDIITHRVDAEWRAKQKRLLSAAVADHRDSWPTVPVEVEVRHQWPADVLVDDSRNASLVVIGRRGARGWIPEHLGSLARTVLRASMCPVMVVPVASDSQPSDDWELSADEVAPQA